MKEPELRRLQTFLKSRNLYASRVDGRLGPATASGLQTFARQNGVTTVTVGGRTREVRIDSQWGPVTAAAFDELVRKGRLPGFSGGSARPPQGAAGGTPAATLPVAGGNKPLTLSGSVGKGGRNRPYDVLAIEDALNAARGAVSGSWPAVQADGACSGKESDPLVKAIVAFQAEVMKVRRPDGVVDPGGATLRRLVELKARGSAGAQTQPSAKGHAFERNWLGAVWYETTGREANLTEVMIAYRKQYPQQRATPAELAEFAAGLNASRYPKLAATGPLQPGWRLRMPDVDDVAERMMRRLRFNGGQLHVLNAADEVELNVPALSGILSHNVHHFRKLKIHPSLHGDYVFPEHQHLENIGPIPEGEYYAELHPGVPAEKSGPGWGAMAVRLVSTQRNVKRAVRWATSKDFLRGLTGEASPYYARAGFFLHEDDSKNGTAGCVGILGRAEALRIHRFLKEYEGERGYGRIHLTVDYSEFQQPDLPNIERPTEEMTRLIGGGVSEKLEKHQLIVFGGWGGVADMDKRLDRNMKTGTSELVKSVSKEFPGLPIDAFDGQLVGSGGVSAAFDAVREGYEDGGAVVIYGYSVGGLDAVALCKKLADDPRTSKIRVELLITVDASEGVAGSNSVPMIPANVQRNLNIYQSNPAGASQERRLFGLGPGGSMAHGRAHSASNSSKTTVDNKDWSSKYESNKDEAHGNIDNDANELCLREIVRILQAR